MCMSNPFIVCATLLMLYGQSIHSMSPCARLCSRRVDLTLQKRRSLLKGLPTWHRATHGGVCACAAHTIRRDGRRPPRPPVPRAIEKCFRIFRLPAFRTVAKAVAGRHRLQQLHLAAAQPLRGRLHGARAEGLAADQVQGVQQAENQGR